MRNDELFSPHCPTNLASRLVLSYVLRGLLGNNGAYYPERLLARQYAVYGEWLAAMRKYKPKFNCGFYEWLSRDCDSAFVLKPGDLVKYSGQYCVVTSRHIRDVVWTSKCRLYDGAPEMGDWPKPIISVDLKDSVGKVSTADVLGESIEPADIPPEIFALACEQAKDCPVMKGGEGCGT